MIEEYFPLHINSNESFKQTFQQLLNNPNVNISNQFISTYWQLAKQYISIDHLKDIIRNINIGNFKNVKIIMLYLLSLFLNPKLESVNTVWKGLFILSEKLISQSIDNKDNSIDLFLSKLVKLTKIKQIQLNQENIIEFLDEQQKFTNIEVNECFLMKQTKFIIKIYNCILGFRDCSVRIILQLTYHLIKFKEIKHDLQNNIYKLGKWIENKQVNFSEIKMLFNIITGGQYEEKVRVNTFEFKNPKQSKFKTLYTAFFKKLFECTSLYRDKFLIQVIKSMVFQDQNLIELFFQYLNYEKSPDVSQTLINYMHYHISTNISVKKVKLLLRNLRLTAPSEDQKVQYNKLKSYVQILQDITKKYPQKNLIIEFDYGSNLKIQNLSQKQFTLAFLLEIFYDEHKERLDIINIHCKKNVLLIYFKLIKEEKQKKMIINIMINNKITTSEIVHITGEDCSDDYFFSVHYKSNRALLYINSILLDLKEVNLEIQKLEFGSFNANSEGFRGKLKLFAMFNADIQPQSVFKEWIDCENKNYLLLKKLGQQNILIKMIKGENIFKDYKQKSFIQKLIKRSLKFQMNHVQKYFMPSMIEIFQQLGLDCIMYFLEYLNETWSINAQSSNIITEIFVILKYLFLNDESTLTLDWMENSLSIIGHVFWLLFSKNATSAKSMNLITKMMDFLFFFQKKSIDQFDILIKSRYHVLQSQIIKKILLNFEIWVVCPIQSQKYILKSIQKQLTSQIIYESITSENIIDKLLNILIIYYNNNNDQFYTQQEINEMQNEILRIVSLILNNPLYNLILFERDVETILEYIYISQSQENLYQKYKSKQLNIKLLVLFYEQYLMQESIKEILTIDHSYFSNMYLFFCRSLKNQSTQNQQIFNVLVKIIFKFIEIQDIQETIFMNLINSLYLNSKQYGFHISFYFQILNQLVKSNFKAKKIMIHTFLESLYKCIQVCDKIDSQEVMQSDLFSLPQNSFFTFINSKYLFEIFTFINAQSNTGKSAMSNLFNKIFIVCFDSENSEKALPYFQNYLKIFWNSRLQVQHNPTQSRLIHLLIQNVDSKYLYKLFVQNNILNQKPYLKVITNQEQKIHNEYEGGTLGHYLCKNSFSFEQLSYLKSRIKKRNRNIAEYSCQENLIEFLLPDIIFMEILKMIYKQNCNYNKQDLLQSSTLQQENNQLISQVITVKQQKSSIEQQQKYLNLLTQLKFSQIIQNIKAFKKVQSLLDQFFQDIQKQCNRNELKKIYCQLNKKIIQKINLDNEDQEYKQFSLFIEELKLYLQLYNQQKNSKVIIKFLDQNLLKFDQLLQLLEKYSKKDIIYIRKFHWFTQFRQVRFYSQHKTIDIKKNIHYQQEDIINQMISQFQESFKNKLRTFDHINQQSQEAWIKIVKKNMFWILNQSDQAGICQVDLHECKNFYYLNIKPTNNKKVFAKYPRRIKISDDKLNESKIFKIKRSNSLLSEQKKSLTDTMELSSSKISERNNSKERIFCEYVTQRGVYFGVLYVKATQLEFETIDQSERPKQIQYRLSTSEYHRLSSYKQKRIDYKDSTLFTRRYILRHTAIQIFSKSKSYFFNLFFEQKRKIILNSLKNKVNCIVNRKLQFQKMQFTKKWLNGQYNNFQYLMILNRYSGRTYHDLSQFPVFPWVISNYSDKIDKIGKQFYKKQQNFRNLEFPVGKLNPERFQNFKSRMYDMGDAIKQNYFLYGTFYSNPTVLYNFFIRLEPFTTLHWQHQGQKIDHADRLFSGIQQQYHSAINNTSDVKQLIPEFYYWPQFLKNRNQIDLGKKQNKQQVNNIILPGWAKTPQQFVFKMRQALESPRVTQKLHHWIDLIFGYKTISPQQAINWDNLFQTYMYQFDIFKQTQQQLVKVKQLSVSEFGQVPETLFTKQHPRKKARKGIKIDSYQEIGKFQNAITFQVYPKGVMLSGQKFVYFVNTLLSIVDIRSQIKKFENIGSRTLLLKQKQFNWISSKQNCLYKYNKKQVEKKMLSSNIFALSQNSLFFTVNGSKIIVYNVINNNFNQMTVQENLYGHQGQINHIILNEDIDILLTVDDDNLVLIHYISTLRYLRHFKLLLNFDEKVKEVRIHDMGYFLFLTTSSRILLYTFFGQLFLESDFIAENETFQKITNIQFISEYQSIILFSTVQGNIYQIDFFDIWRFKQKYPYLRFKMKVNNNILMSCSKDSLSKRNDHKYLNDTKHRNQIIYFNVIKSSNEYKGLFKILVLYKNGDLLYFYEKDMIREQIQNTAFLKQMGMF